MGSNPSVATKIKKIHGRLNVLTNVILIYFMSRKTKYNKDVLSEAVKDCQSVRQVLKKLGLKSDGGGTYSYISNKLLEHQIDTSHFLGQAHLKGKTHSWSKNTPLKEILIENSKYSNTNNLRNKLIKFGLFQKICSKCGLSEWNDLPIPLELDHINGIRTDNRIDNLRILCPNCHAQTPTYCGKNIKKKSPKSI